MGRKEHILDEPLLDESPQAESGSDKEGVVIENANCFDGRKGFLHEVVRRRLTSIGEGRYVDDEDWIYERAIPRADDPGQKFSGTGERYDREGAKRF